MGKHVILSAAATRSSKQSSSSQLLPPAGALFVFLLRDIAPSKKMSLPRVIYMCVRCTSVER